MDYVNEILLKVALHINTLNPKDLLDYIQSWSLSSCNTILAFDFSPFALLIYTLIYKTDERTYSSTLFHNKWSTKIQLSCFKK